VTHYVHVVHTRPVAYCRPTSS